MRRRRRRRAAPQRGSGSSREQLLKDLVTRGHEGPSHATAHVRDGAGPNLQPLSKVVKVSLAPDALRGRHSPLAPRPAPVQRRVVVGTGGERRVEALEGEDQTVAFGVLERGPGRVEAGAVELGGGGALAQRGGERPAPAGHDPVYVGEREAQAVADLPHRSRGLEEPLELVAEGEGEPRREVRAGARVELARGVAEAGLEAGAGRRREGPGGRHVGDEGGVVSCHFTSNYPILT